MAGRSLCAGHRRGNGITAACVFVLLAATASCSSEGRSARVRASEAGPDAPVVTPASPYAALPYVDRAQRATFEAFVSCAARHGLEYEGPFTDSTGKGVFFRLAAGATASRSDQDDVNADCPQMTVGLFATPVGDVRVPSNVPPKRSSAACARTAIATCHRCGSDEAIPSTHFGGSRSTGRATASRTP
jgi:hypothetical protein